jgi:hypothetical protein
MSRGSERLLFLLQMPAEKLWSTFISSFYSNLELRPALPNRIEWLFPQDDERVLKMVEAFAEKFYCDGKTRRLLLGINPGRFGAGVTGVNFTAPRQLKENLGMDHPFKDQSELSAEFVYAMISAYGGPEKFYSDYFIGSVCPLGFVKDGKNLNYYDDKALLETVEPFIVRNLQKLVAFKVQRDICFSIGEEKNYKYLLSLNKRFGWFERIEPLPHPRFIMQYRRRQVPQFIDQYLRSLIPIDNRQ